MIQRIYVLSYPEMQDKLIELPSDARIIGCTDVGGLVLDPLFETDDYKLALQFDDCTLENAGSRYKPLSDDQAYQIVRFILNLLDGRVRHDLYVHCVGGQCRSAAIAKFAAWVSNLERKDIKTNNPYRPNEHVENLLFSVYRKHIMSGAI